MPICNKLPVEGDSKITASTEIDDHASEVAKVRRQREQAYFNSYNFDAIEVLPYEEDEHPPPAVRGRTAEYRRRSPTKQSRGMYKSQSSRTIHQPSSPISRRRLKNSLLMVKRGAGSRSSTSSSRSSGSNSSFPQHGGGKYAYLQRLGSFFSGSGGSGSRQFRRSTSMTNSMQSSESGNSEPLPYEVILGIRDSSGNKKLGAEESGSFLLPRAMLKYQSSGSVNSMPLAATSSAHNNKLRQNSSNVGSSNNNSSNNNNTSFSIISSYNNITEIGSKNTGNGFLLQMANSSGNKNMPTLRSSKKTRLTNTYGHAADNTGFLIIAEKSSAPNGNPNTVVSLAITTTTATIAPSLDASTTLARSKKQSTGSIITTTTTSSIESAPTIITDTDGKLKPDPSKSKSPTTITATTSSSSATMAAANRKSVHEQQRDRASSHQSHYSTTDKSGSSGYYSSNVCSTYSLEDHIYCEPVGDILDLNSKSDANIGKVEKLQHAQQKVSSTSAKVEQSETNDIGSPVRDLKATGCDVDADGQTQRHKDCDGKNDERSGNDINGIDGDEELDGVILRRGDNMETTLRRQQNNRQPSQHFSENLRILETSIENLDRHLRNFPSLSSQEQIVSFVQTQHSFSFSQHPNNDAVEKSRMQSQLPTIMEGYDPVTQPRPFQDDIADDSLLDIDLDSFLLVNERKGSKHSKSGKMVQNRSVCGIDNPSFLADEQEENNYKCAKYINSCPDDAYRVESDIGGGTRTESGTVSVSEKSLSVENFVKRYEDQLHFQNTRELLEDVRDKIRLLAHSRSESHSNSDGSQGGFNTPSDEEIPKELEGMIKTLKLELESYLNRMNQQSELEIRQLCSGLVKNQKIVKMKKAFERRRSISSLNALDEYEYEGSPYEVVRHGMIIPPNGVPVSIRQKINSIRCVSDPNFKMKRKSLTEVFPTAECYIESISEDPAPIMLTGNRNNARVQRASSTQMQRNLAFHKPILEQADTKIDVNGGTSSGELSRGGSSGTESGEAGDKDSMLEWHRKKPSIWEMYYGTNRMNQTLLGKRNGGILMTSSSGSNQATMSYPSSRPESDFTLDLPRAEQLRIKMEKEKKFRQRCRFITTFLSLLFFVLTVMVVSLVLTRGKRMFGTMI